MPRTKLETRWYHCNPEIYVLSAPVAPACHQSYTLPSRSYLLERILVDGSGGWAALRRGGGEWQDSELMGSDPELQAKHHSWCISRLCTLKTIRRILNIPRDTHNNLLPLLLGNTLPVQFFDDLHCCTTGLEPTADLS